MSVIPQYDLLLVSAKIQTHEIDQVFIRQPGVVRISAFKQRIAPELEATVVGISPCESKDKLLKCQDRNHGERTQEVGRQETDSGPAG